MVDTRDLKSREQLKARASSSLASDITSDFGVNE